MGTARDSGGFLVVVGNSSVGKTRLLYETAREVLPDYAVLAPDLGDGGLVNQIAGARFRLPRLIVWLDGLQRFVPGPYFVPDESVGHVPITAGTVRKLLDANVVILGTLWPEHLTQLRSTRRDPETGTEQPRYPAAVDILSSDVEFLPLETFSDTERTAAAALAGRDPRLARAVADRNYNVTEVLAGAPQIMRRYQQATDTQKAIVHAAVDARRLGIRGPLTAELLCAAARGYLTTVQPEDTWFDQALAELTHTGRRDDRATAPLIEIADAEHKAVTGYTVTDYLLQHLSRHRRSHLLSAVTWQALTDHTGDPGDLRRLADSAEPRLLYQQAEALYTAAADAGDTVAGLRLAYMLAAQGHTGEAIELLRTYADADAGDPDAGYRLAGLLATHGHTDEVIELFRTRADAGDAEARDWLADLLAAQGHTDDAIELFRAPADAGDPDAAVRLAELLTKGGHTDDAIELFRTRADAGHRFAAVRLAELLAAHGRTDDAIELLRAPADAGVAGAGRRLADLLAAQGHTDELRARADAGDPDAAAWLAELLIEEGHTDDAIKLLRTRADAGDPDAVDRLATLLTEGGHTDDAIELLRAHADAGDPGAGRQLADLLTEQGRTDDAIELLRAHADAGDWYAADRLAALLAEQGRTDDAIELLRAHADAGDWYAGQRLADLLAKQGRTDELRALADAGDWYAGQRLAALLAKQGRTDELLEEVRAGTPGANMAILALLGEQNATERTELLEKIGLAPDGSLRI
ncbi:MAG: hypothetical protein QOC93_3829 [Actinomycetota bacterium]|nr:hypothetical protein [Actinomycetota bacterium]